MSSLPSSPCDSKTVLEREDQKSGASLATSFLGQALGALHLSSALGVDDDPEGENICRLPVIVSLATRVLRVIARCWTKPCHSWPDILWQMSDEELGRWYSSWSYILTGYQVLKSACRQKPYIINGSFEKLVNYHKFYLSLPLHSFYGNMFVEMYNI